MSIGIITWEQFITKNNDARGVRFKFEDLCRQLFTNEFLSVNKKNRSVHSNPNNAGIESEPVYDETNQRWIGYQAKFFDDRPGYDQILHSAEKTVKHYVGKVDHIFLYSNKHLSVDASDYRKAVDHLASNNITLELITGDTILDQARKYPYLSSYYFGSHSITYDWIVDHNKYMFAELGERFNREFNVDTDFSLQLSLFVHDEAAIKYINEKKEELISQIDSLNWNYNQYHSYLNTIKETVRNTADIGYINIEDSFQWENNINTVVEAEIEKFKATKTELENRQNELYLAAFRDELISKQEKEMSKNKYFDIGRKIESIDTLLNLPGILSIHKFERQMITGKILVVTGEAGIGKSQMLANEVEKLIKNNRNALLFLAGLYFTDDPIQEQIMKNCGLDFSFNDLIDILEAMGEAQGKIIPVLIDALNETWNNALWKKHLPVIIDKIEGCNYVKLAFSFRSEYEKQLMNQNLIERIKSQSICHISHRGFERNSIEASKQFFNYYGIPFTSFEYFEYEMTNPLFLTLYCRTYKGDEVDLPTLYERFISNANENIQKSMANSLRQQGYSGAEDLLSPLINELASSLADRGVRAISKEELLSLNYWKKYGIVAPPFILQIIREHILHSYVYGDKEELYFAYDQMNDYFCAKAIVNQVESKDDVKEKILTEILQIKDGKVGNYGNRDLFINVCVLYMDKFGEECINLIDDISDDYDKYDLFSRYIQSFQWRNKDTISEQGFLNLIRKYPSEPKDIWKLLIGNSVKTGHPLNADFLHNLLMGYELNKRDYIWTTYINTVFSDDTNRIMQLIQMYNKGESIIMRSKKQTELLLTLFGWLLTASDRSLRDYASKAMIEFMKQEFDLCEIMLKKFEGVNDPYVLQRLYGVVFGACCKRKDGQNDVYRLLSEYIYITIFDQEQVYPDILLRDYARLIIERFLWEQPDYDGIIDRYRSIPPYKSSPVPVVSEDYTKMKFDGGLLSVSMSMKFENMGMYGDFGRYVFQSALRNFDVNHRQIYNYAMSFIINELGYKEEWFDHHGRRYNYNRHDTMKVERIGKKYPWIAMYNILARVSDHNEMRERYSINNNARIPFEGAWEPYIRDFDPTLNCNFMFCEEAPVFKQIDEFVSAARNENTKTAISDKNSQRVWLEDEGVFFKNLKDIMHLTDDTGTQWVSLTKYCDTGRNDLKDEKLLVWSWLYAYFVTPEQEKAFAESVNKGVDLRTQELDSHNQTYVVFNREYPWSPSCKSLKEYAWIDVHIKTGDKETVTETRMIPDLSPLDAFLKKLDYCEDEEIDENLDFQDESVIEEKMLDETDCFEIPEIVYKELIVEKEVEKEIGKILHASSDLLWEEEFDASKVEAISWSVPCAELIETLHLRQLKSDGFYYDEAGNLAAFDTRITQHQGGVVVRKDLLDTFLNYKGMKLIWILNADKEIHNSDLSISQWSEWTALLSYDRTNIKGNICRMMTSV
ncbi:hypothetical protein R2R35_06225 [Anaerocolumna sp. AGMB13020]|uniref:hypothetical protein n=1 Tax=Anaerocolumna sp. AGMB13020 TaxID=3081750 RepID=UPI002954F15A|nr:hypothetical protein [Anaerocolumna sp. AGMB13020]WOO38095.1 hypothetical protein R2R35_06225 [Anaerocolumna sp. AGMB13020]